MEVLKGLIQYKTIDSRQFPTNLEFFSTTNDSRFLQPGIFFLFFRGELIYIGYSENHQNIVAERVVRQISTITLRDHRLQFTKTALGALSNLSVFNSYFILPKPIVANADYVTSVNRAHFASSHWDEFKDFNNETLSRFEIEWYPNPELNNYSSIEDLSIVLINKHNPRCNRQYVKPILSNN
jgi:hypothetical protein